MTLVNVLLNFIWVDLVILEKVSWGDSPPYGNMLNVSIGPIQYSENHEATNPRNSPTYLGVSEIL